MDAKHFAAYFKHFQFEYHEEIQPWDIFLKTEKGDCDDYATLGDDVLTRRGTQTRLITVRMPGLVHVVCYVVPEKCYLDYNLREFLKRTASSPDSVPEIAERVAKSFDANWTSATEFIFRNGMKRSITTIAKVSVKK